MEKQLTKRAVLRKRKVRRRRAKRAAIIVGILIVALIASILGLGIYLSSLINISRADDFLPAAEYRPSLINTPVIEDDLDDEDVVIEEEITVLHDPMNILITAIDNDLGFGASFNADTIILVHIPADRSYVEAINISRDALVTIPPCLRDNGSTTNTRHFAMVNSAFALGAFPSGNRDAGMACLIQTVELLTDIKITDHVILEVYQVREIVNALGGVPVDLPEAVVGNRNVNLNLPAGPQVLTGYQSINFLRARGGRGMGLEIGSNQMRIERQEFFLRSLIDSISMSDITIEFISTVLNALRISEDLARFSTAFELARTLSNLENSDFYFTRLPSFTSPRNRNRVEFRTDEMQLIFERVKQSIPPIEPDLPLHFDMSRNEEIDIIEYINHPFGTMIAK